MVELIKVILLAVALMSLSACGLKPVSLDYSYSLPGDFVVYRTSGDNVVIESNDGRDGVPAKVVEIGWNDRFILAKQQLFKDRNAFSGDTFQLPDPARVQFWIIDVINTNRVGPLNETEFVARKTSLGVPNQIVLKPAAAFADE